MTSDVRRDMADRSSSGRPLWGFQNLVVVPILISTLALIATACGGGDADAGLTWTVSAAAPAPAPTTTIDTPAETAPDTTAPGETAPETTAPGDVGTPSTTEVAPETTAPGGGESPPSPPADDELLALGKVIFEETAGGVGCASCHGFDGHGTPNGPNIIGLSRQAIAGAMAGGVPDMSDIDLTSNELDAVAAYLDTLP
jgi:hypothetical protein